MNEAKFPYDYIADPAKGRPLFNADLYYGIPDLDPAILANQIQISVRQEDGSVITVAQPLNTGFGGIPLYNGSPVTVLIDEFIFSFKALNNLGAQIYYEARAEAGLSPESAVGTQDTYADVRALTASYPFEAIIVGGASVVGVGGGPFYYDSSDVSSADNNATILVDASGRRWKRVGKFNDEVDIREYGAIPNDPSVDNSGAIHNAVAASSAAYPIIDLAGQTWYVANGLSFTKNLLIKDGVIQYNGVDNDVAIVSFGDILGDSLVRGARAQSVRAKIAIGTTNTGMVGFRLLGLVRSSSLSNCVAEMFGDDLGTKNHLGFQIKANRIAASTAAGAYQNTLDTCTALFANIGYNLVTEGSDAQAKADPQANGNYLKNCFAYSCTKSALKLGYGAQENECEVRADTFPSQLGSGTTVNVIDVDGGFNTVTFVEEIGSIADTQYSVRLGDNAIYNVVSGSTQNIVTGFLNDASSPQGKREKNIIKQLGSGLLDAASTEVFSFYGSVPAGVTQSIVKVIPVRKKCVVSSIQVLCTTITGATDTRFYVAKNAAFATDNRLVMPASTAANTVYTQKIDSSAGVDIGAQWSYSPGDRINIAFDIPATGAQIMAATVSIVYI